QGKNMLIVESLQNGKRMPAYATDKVVSVGEIAIYTEDEDVPLGNVFQAIKEKNEGKTVDVKALGNDTAIRSYFKEILPKFDEERVYTNDIKKVFSWYNILTEAGMTDFVSKEEASDEEKA
ncbi:MAG: DUF5606 domain-containing protein, partial [Muribaculaceae bacterium]|nr:DUF5606 domain-containing protein [Muribaculaceae bacterium]